MEPNHFRLIFELRSTNFTNTTSPELISNTLWPACLFLCLLRILRRCSTLLIGIKMENCLLKSLRWKCLNNYKSSFLFVVRSVFPKTIDVMLRNLMKGLCLQFTSDTLNIYVNSCWCCLLIRPQNAQNFNCQWSIDLIC